VVVPQIRISEPQVSADAPAAAQDSTSDLSRGRTLLGKVQRFGDHIDTDAIIPGEFCHLTSLEQLGEHAFHHVRPEFSRRAQQGQNIVVAGEGWGTGSSREQAVWALLGAGIKAVVAKSYAFIHKRNLVNEALPYLVVRDESFYALAGEGDELSIDLAAGEVTHRPSGRAFKAEKPSPIVSALQRQGGLVPAIKNLGPQVFEALGSA
jgi:aconitate hydratase/homoaconitate hydratase